MAFFAAFWVPMLFLQLPLVGVFFYFFTIFDAYRQAQLINIAAEEGHELPASAFHGGITAGVFLIVLGVCVRTVRLLTAHPNPTFSAPP